MTDEHGILAEDNLEEICYRLFGPDVVLRSPVLMEESGPKELTDVLVILDDTAIIIQSKSLALEASELDEIKFGRVLKRHNRAKQQINTTLNAQARNAKVRASTPFGIDFDVDWSRIRHKFGLITLSLPDAAYADPEFRFQYPHMVESYKGIEVHTFLLNDLWIIASELTTPADVLLYLRARAQCAKSGKFIIGNELDLLAFFKIRYPEIDKALTDPEQRIFITPGYWEDYQQKHAEKIKDRDKRLGNSFVIDRLISRLRTSVEHSTQEYGISPQESASNYLTLIGKLHKLTKIERAWIGDRLIEKMEKTKTDKWGYFTYVSQQADTGYLFLILNETDRKRRKDFLHFLCEQACHAIPCSELVGIASDGVQQKTHSIDAMILDVKVVKAETEPDPNYTVFQKPAVGKISEWNS